MEVWQSILSAIGFGAALGFVSLFSSALKASIKAETQKAGSLGLLAIGFALLSLIANLVLILLELRS